MSVQFWKGCTSLRPILATPRASCLTFITLSSWWVISTRPPTILALMQVGTCPKEDTYAHKQRQALTIRWKSWTSLTSSSYVPGSTWWEAGLLTSCSTTSPPLPSPSMVTEHISPNINSMLCFAQAGRSTLSWDTTPSLCWRSSWPWWRCREGCWHASPTSPISPSSPTGACSASCPSTQWCGSGRLLTRWETFPPRQQCWHWLPWKVRNMENTKLANRISDAFMYIVPAISIVFSVVRFSGETIIELKWMILKMWSGRKILGWKMMVNAIKYFSRCTGP